MATLKEKEKMLKDYYWLISVVDSCKTLDQVTSCKRLVRLFIRKHSYDFRVYSICLEIKLERIQDQLQFDYDMQVQKANRDLRMKSIRFGSDLMDYLAFTGEDARAILGYKELEDLDSI